MEMARRPRNGGYSPHVTDFQKVWPTVGVWLRRFVMSVADARPDGAGSVGALWRGRNVRRLYFVVEGVLARVVLRLE
jgi:hypothetical protein